MIYGPLLFSVFEKEFYCISFVSLCFVKNVTLDLVTSNSSCSAVTSGGWMCLCGGVFAIVSSYGKCLEVERVAGQPRLAS